MFQLLGPHQGFKQTIPFGPTYTLEKAKRRHSHDPNNDITSNKITRPGLTQNVHTLTTCKIYIHIHHNISQKCFKINFHKNLIEENNGHLNHHKRIISTVMFTEVCSQRAITMPSSRHAQ